MRNPTSCLPEKNIENHHRLLNLNALEKANARNECAELFLFSQPSFEKLNLISLLKARVNYIYQ